MRAPNWNRYASPRRGVDPTVACNSRFGLRRPDTVEPLLSLNVSGICTAKAVLPLVYPEATGPDAGGKA